jgi:hypothetical protein
MSAKVQQLCASIAQHPSKINLVNEALQLAFQKTGCHDLELVLRLI